MSGRSSRHPVRGTDCDPKIGPKTLGELAVYETVAVSTVLPLTVDCATVTVGVGVPPIVAPTWAASAANTRCPCDWPAAIAVAVLL